MNKILISLDFGSSKTGFLYSFLKEDLFNFNVYNQWENTNSSLKTLTAILYKLNEKNKQEPINFGWSAIKYYENLLKIKKGGKNLSPKDLTLFHNFKTLIEEGKTLKFSNGEDLSIDRLIIDVFCMLKSKILSEISQKTTKKITEKDLRWVITIPTFWKDKQRVLLKKAALEAKMIDSISDGFEKFMFVYEPEATLLYQIVSQNKIKREDNIEVGEKVLTANIGSGIIDLMFHGVEKDNKVNELLTSLGDSYPNKKTVEDVFFDYLRYILGDSVINEIINQREVFDILRKWYDIKETFISNPKEFGEFLRFNTKQMNIIKNNNPNFYRQIIDDCIKITYTDLEKIFSYHIGLIEKYINNFIENSKIKVDKILLSGGLINSSFFKHKLGEIFGKRFRVIFPDDSTESVLKGAIFFARNTSLISSRIMRRTYGVGGYSLFDVLRHKESKKVILPDGRMLCKDVFDIWIKKGERISHTGHKIIKKYPLIQQGQNSMNIPVLSTLLENPTYTDDDLFIESDLSIDIQILNVSYSSNRILNLEITFGLTDVLLVPKIEGVELMLKYSK